MKRLGNEKLKFIGRHWNGLSPSDIWHFRSELYYDDEDDRYLLITKQGIDSWPKRDFIEYLNEEQAKEWAADRLAWDEYELIGK
jgi:hypothetical protein